jgi:glucose-1-phosphate adenylyltransferase
MSKVLAIVLAGDHIYRMDYGPMITFHEQHRADVTLGAVVVPLEEGHRFGILETDAEGRVVSFEEKPREPRGTLGSMGIYVFDRETLIRVLIENARAATSFPQWWSTRSASTPILLPDTGRM